MGSARRGARSVTGRGEQQRAQRHAATAFVAVTAGLLVFGCGNAAPGEAGPEAREPAARQAPAVADEFAHVHHHEPDPLPVQSQDGAQSPERAHDHGAHDHGAHDHGSPEHEQPGGHGHHGAAEVAREARLSIEPDGSGRRLLLSLGPVRLPAAGEQAVMRITPGLEAPIGFGGWLIGMNVRLEDAHGEVLPNELLHHVNLILPGRRDLFRPMMQRLAAAGPETDAMRLPWPLGLRIGEEEDLLVVAVLHNESARDYGDVYLRAEIETRRRGRMAAYPFMIDVIPPPLPAAWDLPPGRSERSWEGSPAVDGRILGIGSHMHRYGKALILEDLTEGRVLYESRPVLDADGEILSIPQEPLLPFGVRLRADHRYRVTAVYDNPTDETIVDGAMGVFGGIFRPSGGWPVLDPSSPLYQDDRAAIRQ